MYTDTESVENTPSSETGESETSDINSPIAYDGKTMWDRIQQKTLSDNRDHWLQLFQDDKSLFRMRFKDYYIESCKVWLYTFNEFFENDDTWSAVMETKSKLYEDVSDDEEALLSAIDKRKYKLLKHLDWNELESILVEDDDEASEQTDEA